MRAKQTIIRKNPSLQSHWVLKPVSSEQLERKCKKKKKSILKTMTARKKLLLQRRGIRAAANTQGVRICHCTFESICVKFCLKHNQPVLKEEDEKHTEKRLKTSPMFLSKAFTFNTYTAFKTHDSLLCAAPVRESKQRGRHAFV